MAQFARPDADALVGNFENEATATTNLFQSIDEVSASDADFVQSPVSPVNEVYVARLGDVTDPASSTGHVMRMRSSNDIGAGGETLDYTLELRQGYVDETTKGTLIASLSRTSVNSSTWTDSSHTLSGAEADAITDYTALFYRLVINKP